MIKEYFFTGKTTEQALEKATLELNISEDEITYEIDQMPVKGFLGIGGNAAKIKVTVDDGIKETST
ncbi:MAG: Jag N-terminal domain-containing protein, partial [Clostridia bacterium]